MSNINHLLSIYLTTSLYPRAIQCQKGFQKAISIRCSGAFKEMCLVMNNAVELFTCFELSDVRINAAKLYTKKWNLVVYIFFGLVFILEVQRIKEVLQV